MDPSDLDKLFVQVESILHRDLLATAFSKLHDLGHEVTRVCGKRWQHLFQKGGQGINSVLCQMIVIRG